MFRKEVNTVIPSKFHKKIGKVNYSTQTPSLKPKKIKPRRKVVFVNPDDDHYLYWWPALVVPEIEYNLFKQSYDDSNNFKIPKENEILVCYFEDGSFSVIPESDSVPFSLNTSPYTKYLSDPNISTAFKNDKAVKLAKLYLETGEIPSTFLWLKDVPTEDKDKYDKINDKNKVEERKKKLLSSAYLQKRREKKEKEILKKSPKLQNKPSPVVKLSNIKNTQSQEFKHNKLSELKNPNKLYVLNNGMIKHINKSNDTNISSDKNDATTTSVTHHNSTKNEISKINKSSSLSSSVHGNGNNSKSPDIPNSKNEFSKQSIKSKSTDYESSSVSIKNTAKIFSANDSMILDNKSYESPDESSSISSSVKRSRKVSMNKEKIRDAYSSKEENTVNLPESLKKPLIFNIKKQNLFQPQDESDLLSIFPEPKKKRLKKSLDAIQNFIIQSIDNEKTSKSQQDIFPLPPIQIIDA